MMRRVVVLLAVLVFATVVSVPVASAEATHIKLTGTVVARGKTGTAFRVSFSEGKKKVGTFILGDQQCAGPCVSGAGPACSRSGSSREAQTGRDLDRHRQLRAFQPPQVGTGKLTEVKNMHAFEDVTVSGFGWPKTVGAHFVLPRHRAILTFT